LLALPFPQVVVTVTNSANSRALLVAKTASHNQVVFSSPFPLLSVRFFLPFSRRFLPKRAAAFPVFFFEPPSRRPPFSTSTITKPLSQESPFFKLRGSWTRLLREGGLSFLRWFLPPQMFPQRWPLFFRYGLFPEAVGPQNLLLGSAPLNRYTTEQYLSPLPQFDATVSPLNSSLSVRPLSFSVAGNLISLLEVPAALLNESSLSRPGRPPPVLSLKKLAFPS